MTHIYVDADIPLYKFSVTHTSKTGETNLEGAAEGLARNLETLQRKLKADKMTLVFSGQGNFRKTLNRCYKLNRPPSPELRTPLKQAMMDKFETKEHSGLEADDVLGIICTSPTAKDVILVSSDKDMLTLPCTIYNPDTEVMVTQDIDEADRMFWTQAIIGDPTDGYYGIPGVGVKRAQPMVQTIMSHSSLQDRIDYLVSEYEFHYLDRAYALRQMQMAYILRASDYNRKNSTIHIFGTEREFQI